MHDSFFSFECFHNFANTITKFKCHYNLNSGHHRMILQRLETNTAASQIYAPMFRNPSGSQSLVTEGWRSAISRRKSPKVCFWLHFNHRKMGARFNCFSFSHWLLSELNQKLPISFSLPMHSPILFCSPCPMTFGSFSSSLTIDNLCFENFASYTTYLYLLVLV